MTCTCRVCTLLRRIKPLLDKATRGEKDAMEQLFDEWENDSNDACYWEMVAKGTWPSRCTRGVNSRAPRMMYEDELPAMTTAEYNAWYNRSKVVDGVRMGPWVTA